MNIHYTTLGISHFSLYFINYVLQYIFHITIIELVTSILYVSVPILRGMYDNLIRFVVDEDFGLWNMMPCQLVNSLDYVIKKYV